MHRIVAGIVFKKVGSCEFFIRNKYYTFLELPMCEEQKKHTFQFFWIDVHFTDQNRAVSKNRII